MFLRTCQSCGNKQEDHNPNGKQPTPAYCNRKCKRCGSSDLDYGSEFDDQAERDGQGYSSDYHWG